LVRCCITRGSPVNPRRSTRMSPPGVNDLARDFFKYLKFDIDTRMEVEGRSDPHSLITAHECE
jgi:hypothetical protein